MIPVQQQRVSLRLVFLQAASVFPQSPFRQRPFPRWPFPYWPSTCLRRQFLQPQFSPRWPEVAGHRSSLLLRLFREIPWPVSLSASGRRRRSFLQVFPHQVLPEFPLASRRQVSLFSVGPGQELRFSQEQREHSGRESRRRADRLGIHPASVHRCLAKCRARLCRKSPCPFRTEPSVVLRWVPEFLWRFPIG